MNINDYIYSTIKEACIKKNRLVITFEEGYTIHVFDCGQTCCEQRCVTTDDDVNKLVGGKLIHIQSKPGAEHQAGEYGDIHETVFVEVQSTNGIVTLVNHNEHNGYYGGFDIVIKKVKDKSTKKDYNIYEKYQ